MSKGGLWLYTQIRSAFGIAFMIPFTLLASVICIALGAMKQTASATAVMRVWGNVALGLFGITCEVTGEERLPASGGGIVVFNHQSLFDIPVLMQSTLKHIRFGAKIELFSIPFFGAAMRAVGTLPIARENRSQVMRIYKEAEARFAENLLFVLAPEGTRQKEPQIGRFKKGPFLFAINAGVPLIPVVIKGTHAVLPKKSLSINVGRRTRTIHVEYLPPVPTTGLDPRKIEEVLEPIREKMVETYARLPVDE